MRAHVLWRVLFLLSSGFILSSTCALAQPPEQAVGTDSMVPMRDGVKLGTTVFLPKGEGPWPVIVTRTPYNKVRYPRRAPRYTSEGYAFVTQDCRGRFSSEGSYEPYQTEINLSAVEESRILKLRKQAYRRFYLSPKRMWRLFRLIPNKSNMLPFLALLFARRAYAR